MSRPPFHPAFYPALMLPGYGGSGPDHWQSLWEKILWRYPPLRFHRVEETDWDAPRREDWVDALEKAVAASGPGTVLVAHSLACLQVAHWVAHSAPSGATTRNIHAAMLVAPPDPKAPVFPPSIRGFDEMPVARFPFETLVVGSTNDPYASPEFTQAAADAWGARVVSAGALGHINAGSCLGDWPQGRKLLETFLAST